MADSVVLLDQPLSFPPGVSDFAAERLEAFFMGHSMEGAGATPRRLRRIAGLASRPAARSAPCTPSDARAALFAQLPELPAVVSPAEKPLAAAGEETEPGEPEVRSPYLGISARLAVPPSLPGSRAARQADLSPTEVTPTEDYCDEDGDELESTPQAKAR